MSRSSISRYGGDRGFPVPLYEYVCQKCSASFEDLSSRPTTAPCPKCGTDTERVLFSRVAVASSKAAEAAPSACGRCGDPRGPGACGMS